MIGRFLVAGRAGGPPLILDEPLSMWGGLDPDTGTIIDAHHPQAGEVVTGRILAMAAARGSSSASSVIAEALRLGTAPSGLILGRTDGIVVIGALVAEELYGTTFPIVVLEDGFDRLARGDVVTIDGPVVNTISIEETDASGVLPMRHAILRPGRPESSAAFDGDERGTHLVAREPSGNIVGVATSLDQSLPDVESPAVQIRGMAVDEQWRGLGIGSALLVRLIERASAPLIWCNARPDAVTLYQRHGFVASGDPFVNDVGPHQRMVRHG